MRRESWSCGACLFFLGSFKKPVQAGAANSKQLGCTYSVASARLEDPPDVLAANLFQWKWTPGVPRTSAGTGGFLQVFRQIVNVDKFVYRGEARAGNHIFEFADITRPCMLEQDGLRPPGQPLNLLAVGLVIFLEEILDEQRNVV